MTSYYTRAKARSDLEGEELEQRDVAPVATTSTSASILPVGLYDASTGESESVSAETAGPATTHPELSPAGDHPSAGGRGTLGSADSPLVGVATLGCPSGHADPFDSAFSGLVGTAEVTTTADTTRTPDLTSRQPPTLAQVTTAASRSPTLVPTITNIVNLSLISGQFHHALKESVISPLLKKPTLDKEELSNANLESVSHFQNNRTCCQIQSH